MQFALAVRSQEPATEAEVLWLRTWPWYGRPGLPRACPGRSPRYVSDSEEIIFDLSKTGALAVGVPGTVDGMAKAHARFGSMPWADLVAPAISLAREGYALSYSQASSLNYTSSAFAPFEASRKYFWATCEKSNIPTNTNIAEAASVDKATNSSTDDSKNKSCRAFEEGEHFQQIDLALTLEAIAENGRDGFYKGWVAERIVKTMKKYNGLISHEDLMAYKSVWRVPYEINFRGYRLHIMLPPSSGSIAVGQILRMMETQELDSMEHHSRLLPPKPKHARAFADRAHYLGDPDFYMVPTRRWSQSGYAADRMASFDINRATPSEEIAHGSGYTSRKL